MNAFPGRNEKRQTVRCLVSDRRREGELRFGKNRLKIQLLDESAGGIGALCVQFSGVEIGATGILRAGEDWFNVRLVNIQPVETAPIEVDGETCLTALFKPSAAETTAETGESPPAPPPEPLPTLYRLGLCRLGDTVDPEIKPAYHSWAGLSCQLKQIRPSTWGTLVAGMMLSILVAMLPYNSMHFINSDKVNVKLEDETRLVKFLDSKASKKSDNGRRIADEDDAEGYSLFKLFAADASKRWDGTAKAANGDFAPGQSLSARLDSGIEELRRTIRGLDGAMPFTLPEVVRQLQLTETQLKRIRELIDSAAELIEILADFPGTDNEKALIQTDILNGARHMVLDLLDEKQKMKWKELTGESGNEEQKTVERKK